MDATLESLVGQDLSAVAFVQDYVEFHFDGPILRALANPTLALNGKEYRFPEAGSRDALCNLIGLIVRSVRLTPDVFELTTGNDFCLKIPLIADGPEAMHFVAGLNQPIQVW